MKKLSIIMSLMMLLSLVQVSRVNAFANPAAKQDEVNQGQTQKAPGEEGANEDEANPNQNGTNGNGTTPNQNGTAPNQNGTTPNQNGVTQQSDKDVLDTVLSNDRLKTLAATLKATGLDEVLKGKGPFTLFAPTDDAFNKIPKAKLDELLKVENKAKLSGILAAHLTSMKFPGSSLVNLNGKEIPMSNGKKAKVSVNGSEVTIDGAKVIVKDIVTKNGIIHLIDTVIMK